MMRRAKIVCTIGPASSKRNVLFSLIKNGMDVARLNFSHGDHESHQKAVELVREGSAKYKRPVAILQDLQGIKIRVGTFKEGAVALKKGALISVSPGNKMGDANRIYISYPNLIRDAKKGDRILLDDGLIQIEVVSKGISSLKARVIEGGMLKNKKGANIPFKTSTPAFTEKDKADLDFGIKMGVDYVALSFVRSVADIEHLTEYMRKKQAALPVIAKIEKPEALTNIKGIIDKVDGIMIARGDLGVETSPQRVPIIQKQLIELAGKSGKLVITATQMLESMTEHLRPTRAETSDVANAVIDGTDALMLSAETTTGKYPVESLKMMNEIIEQTEAQFPPKLFHMADMLYHASGALFSEAVADAACRAAESINAKFIAAFTHSGFTARLVSKFRPSAPIIAFTPREGVMRMAALYWGVTPKLARTLSHTDEMVKEVEHMLLKERLVRKGDRIVITASTPILGKGKTNLLKLHTIGE